MTSIEFFHHLPQEEVAPPNWGTGQKGNGCLWIPRAPSWHSTGIPTDIQYKLTELKLSHVRDNDELIPRPQAVDISKRFINRPFPAEHPYASHIEKFAFIPKFDSPQDPKRGVIARRQIPISDEMPANSFKIKVLKKTKGFPYREEVLTIPSEGRKEALYWQGENFFDQQSKIHGNRQQYYPIPPKQIAPNLQARPEQLCISEKTQNVLRNIERSHWVPTQKLDYTGLGPANPLVLDNLDCKKTVFLETGVLDDKLYPHSINTFDPARSLEGHLRKMFAPKPAQQIMIENQMSKHLDENRNMSLTEIEEHRLLNGRDYVNLPENSNDPLKYEICHTMNYNMTPQQSLELDSTKKDGDSRGCKGQDDPHCKKSKGYLEDFKIERYKATQGIEAQNRWRLLESATPSHDVVQLREKYKLLNNKEMPTTYYCHEGKYNEERAGLYKTSYNPQQLAYSMNAQQLSGGVLFNTSMSHVDAGLYPTIVWDENEAALKGSRTVVFKNNELSGDRPGASDILNPYREAVSIQRHILQPTVDTARPLVQEGKFVLREDTYGDIYNTKMFLQENKLDRNIRIEPRDVMSHENQNLERTRETSVACDPSSKLGNLRSVHFSDDVDIKNMHKNMPVKIDESYIKLLSSAEREELAGIFGHDKTTSLSYTHTHPERSQSGGLVIGDKRNLRENLLNPMAVPTIVDRNTQSITKPQFVSFTRQPQLKPAPLSETFDQFRNLSTHFMPVGHRDEPGQGSNYVCQLSGLDLGEKRDTRFNWEPGAGHVRPQSCLQELQNSFVKSEVNKKFHAMFPESNPDIRANFTTGKKHFFNMNA